MKSNKHRENSCYIHADPKVNLSVHDLWIFLQTAHHHAITGRVSSCTSNVFTFKTSAYASIHEAHEALTSINAELRRVGNEQFHYDGQSAALQQGANSQQAAREIARTGQGLGEPQLYTWTPSLPLRCTPRNGVSHFRRYHDPPPTCGAYTNATAEIDSKKMLKFPEALPCSPRPQWSNCLWPFQADRRNTGAVSR